MAGLDRTITSKIDYKASNSRILDDLNTDFIFAPHLKMIYRNAGDFLSTKLNAELESGQFNFSLPLGIGVPKPSGLTRPGSILMPKDRLLYQVLADAMKDEIERNLDRSKVFSNLPAPDNRMFLPLGVCYNKFEDEILKKAGKFKFCIKTDVAAYFETIYQHFMISQLHALNIEKHHINLLEKSLLAWREDRSYGILQGMFPSDLLGNYYLTQIDYYLSLKQLDHVRFVDDVYIFSDSEYELRRSIVEICDTLRQQGLFLNENKTILSTSEEICNQTFEFEALFSQVTDMLDDMSESDRDDFFEREYGFQKEWDEEEDEAVDVKKINGFRLDVIEELYRKKDTAKFQKESVLKFCIPLLTKARSTVPLDTIKEDLHSFPYLTKYYASYLATMDRDDQTITDKLEEVLLDNHFVYEYQQMWLLSAMLYRRRPGEKVIRLAAKYFLNKQCHESIRAICVLLMARHGKGTDRKLLRDGYSAEPSQYVKAAILHSTIYLSSDERTACKIAWGSNNYLNELVVESLKKIK